MGAQGGQETLVLEGLLGEGSYGKVFRATWKGTVVAVKVMVLPSYMSGEPGGLLRLGCRGCWAPGLLLPGCCRQGASILPRRALRRSPPLATPARLPFPPPATCLCHRPQARRSARRWRSWRRPSAAR
jgi:hypothetical protein